MSLPDGDRSETLRPWLEAAAMLAAAAALSALVPVRPPVLDFYALAVVLLSARFGYGLGAAAGVAAGLVSLLVAGQDPAGVLRVFSDRGALAVACAYPALGALVGLVGDVPRQAARRAAEAATAARQDLERLSERYRVLVEAKEAVDRRIVGQVQTVASLYEAARELETLVPDKLPPATLQLLARFLEVEAAAIYRLEGGRLVLVAALGEHAGREDAIDVDDHPLGAVIAGHERMPDPAVAMLAAPLTHPDGRPRGAIAIERLPFRQLTPATQQMLALFADWTSRALANSEAYVEAQERRLDHPATRVPRHPYMTDRLHQEWAAALRYGLPLSAILVRDPALAEGQADWAERAAAIAAQLKARVRTIDVVGHHRAEDAFLMLLPVTPLSGAGILAGRLAEALPGCRVAVGANEEGHADAEAMIQAMQAIAYEEAANVA